MAHKRNLTLVCRKWHAYAQPVLYSFVWIARAKQAKALALTLLCQACWSAGRFIRRLHIETPALERFSTMSSNKSAPTNEDDGPNNLFAKLAEGGGALKRLTWTSYDDPTLVGLGIGLGLRGGHVGERLEYLELNFVSSSRLTTERSSSFSTWGLPALRNLSVVSADFSYAADGFRRFFEVHGGSVRQLELGHSTRTPNGIGNTPDWIAPHLLLPAHPNVSFIGIRGIEGRVGGDGGVGSTNHHAALFGLREQMETLLRREAFPRLKYVRDMSEGSDWLRRGVLVRCREESVWLEDWRGWNVTRATLRRARAALEAETGLV
ncbi:hypothetical protein C8F01DRAFT_1211119 [Mycena amicta]|nr:hypothetical protein C8F01DRAFT_1211119 [Mycena amicta]